MRILSFTTLYPNPSQPVHGVFVENRLRHLAQTGRVSIKVVAPVPWFPKFLAGQKRYGHYARVPLAETRHGLDVIHPRYPTLPKIGMTIAPLLLALSQRAVIAGLIQDGYDFDLIDAHYFYPDGVAAIHLGRWFNKPVIITGRGSDLSQIPQHALPRQQIKWAAARAAGMVTVCQALKDALIALGVAPERVVVLRNGVDLKLFRPPEGPPAREALRARWNFDQFSLGAFDFVIAVAVLEHVVDPPRCVAEIWRVLKPGAYVYAATPFLQPVHMGAYDFTRFTYLGHRRLFRWFDDEASGMALGPGAGLSWSIQYFVTSLTDIKPLRAALRLASLIISIPLKLADYLTRGHLSALDGASGVFFFGPKRSAPISDRDIIKLYRGGF